MKWRKIKYILFHRSVLAGLALVAQVAVLFVMVNEFTAHFDYFYWFCIFVSFLATVWIVSDRSEPGYKIAWLVVILPFPVFGGILYLLLGGNRISERTRRKMKGIAERSNEVLRGDFKADRLTHLDEDAVGQIRYLPRLHQHPDRVFPGGRPGFRADAGGAGEGGALHLPGVFHPPGGGVLERHPGHPGAEGRRRGGGAADL